MRTSRPTSRRVPRTVAAVICGLALLTGGCGDLRQEKPAQQLALTQTQQQLEQLQVAAWTSMAGYSRERFPHWSSQGNGCDTRDVVLQRDGTGVQVKAPCTVTEGSWFSVYDGQTVTDPGEVDVDHVAPLANAWRTGASAWDDKRREGFANDLDRPQLVAVTASVNRSKGDQDPSQWKPPRRGYWCEYAKRWVEVKSYWRLSVTAAEKASLQEMLGTC